MRSILLSFQPEWFERLENGSLKFEYRKNLPAEPVKVYFYVSAPVKAISGIAYFDKPEKLIDWKDKYRNRSIEVQARIDDYLEDCRYAVPILSFQKTNKISLDILRNDISDFIVPRMYYYIENSKLEKYLEARLQNEGKKVENTFDIIMDEDICN